MNKINSLIPDASKAQVGIRSNSLYDTMYERRLWWVATLTKAQFGCGGPEDWPAVITIRKKTHKELLEVIKSWEEDAMLVAIQMGGPDCTGMWVKIEIGTVWE